MWLVCFILYPFIMLTVIRFVPHMGNGLNELIENMNYEMTTRPFAFSICDRTIPAVLFTSLLYFIGFYIYISSMKNTRPGEEYGSAKWVEPRKITRRFSAKGIKDNISFSQKVFMLLKYDFDVFKKKSNVFFSVGNGKTVAKEDLERYKDREIYRIDNTIGIPKWRYNMILSENVRISLKTKQSNINTLILGGSGRGKSRGYIVPNIMQLNSSMVITDPKGEICRMVGRLLKKFGYDVRVLDLRHHEKSHGYNPFVYFREDNDVLLFVNNMWAAMEDKTASSQDPFWPEIAKTMLMSFILYLFHFAPEEEQNFDNVLRLMHLIDIEEEGQQKEAAPGILDLIFNEIPHDDTAYGYYKEWSSAKGRTLASVYVTLSAKMAVFNLESMRKLTFKDEMNILDLATKPVAIFMILPDDNAVYNFLAGTLYTQIFQQLYDYADNVADGPLPRHVRFYMDEFANIALPNDYQKILSTARSRNMSFVIVLQDKQQIEAIFEKYYKTLYGNCSFYLFLGSREYDTCEYYSKLLGKETIVVENFTKNYGRGGGMSKAETRVGRELMTPNELMEMGENKCIIYANDQSGCQDIKTDMTTHRYYRYISDGARKAENAYDWGEDNISEGSVQILDDDYLGNIVSMMADEDNDWEILDPEYVESLIA
ncbi:MAG: type IV secretory system conjugative DNA transfer family protein [Eubacterium sp.]|nr:type IV secretory system conjugative DNA transfer family protein [Eubacterium sp.]